jgi:hypothetical protein
MPFLQGQIQDEHLEAEFPFGVFPKDVFDLCAQRGSLSHLHLAVSLALEHFKNVRKLETRLQQDPDADDQRVIIDVTVDGEIDDALASKKAFDKAWAREAPLSQLDAIRLLFDFG